MSNVGKHFPHMAKEQWILQWTLANFHLSQIIADAVYLEIASGIQAERVQSPSLLPIASLSSPDL